MKLLVFSDVHGDVKALERLLATEADYYFAAGDLVSWGRGLDRMGEALKARAGKLWVLPGNHESEADVAEMCNRFGLSDFHGRNIVLSGCRIAGLGYSNPTPFHTPGEYSEAEIARRLDAIPDGPEPLVLICHCPPKDTPLDRIREGLHAGSEAVARFIERRQPAYFLCGHIHEAEGAICTLGSTFAVNTGKRGYLLQLRDTDAKLSQ